MATFSSSQAGTDGPPGPAPSDPAHVHVPTPSGAVVLVDPRVHRRDVVRRLLRLGVTARTLLALLPDWEPLIRAVIADGSTVDRRMHGSVTPAAPSPKAPAPPV